MQQITSVISGKEQTLFDFTCCVHELSILVHELSYLEIDQMEQLLKKLCLTLHEKQHRSNLVYQHVAPKLL